MQIITAAVIKGGTGKTATPAAPSQRTSSGRNALVLTSLGIMYFFIGVTSFQSLAQRQDFFQFGDDAFLLGKGWDWDTLKRNLALINARPRKVLNFHSAQELWDFELNSCCT